MAEYERSKEEEIKIDLNAEPERSSDQGVNMEWEVETEPAERVVPETKSYSQKTQERTYAYNGQGAAVRSCNKHIFTWVFNLWLGMLGADRFFRGQTALGIAKLCTGGGFGYWYLIDLIIAIVKSYAGEYETMNDVWFDENGNYTSF